MAVSVKWRLCVRVCVFEDWWACIWQQPYCREREGWDKGKIRGEVLKPPHPHRLILTQPWQKLSLQRSSINFSGPIQMCPLPCCWLKQRERDHTHFKIQHTEKKIYIYMYIRIYLKKYRLTHKCQSLDLLFILSFVWKFYLNKHNNNFRNFTKQTLA